MPAEAAAWLLGLDPPPVSWRPQCAKQQSANATRGRRYRVTAALDAGIGGRSQCPNAIARSATTGAIGLATFRSSAYVGPAGVATIAFVTSSPHTLGGCFATKPIARPRLLFRR
jgi:hypothetical protein